MENIKKVIVTGGYGFIGSNLIKYLLKKNYFVINIDKLAYAANLYNLKNLKTNKYIFHKIDINNIAYISIRELFPEMWVNILKKVKIKEEKLKATSKVSEENS